MKKYFLLLSFCFVAIMTYSQAWMQYLPAGKTESSLTFFDYKDAFNQWCIAKSIDKEGYFINSIGERQKAAGWKQFRRWQTQMELMGNYDPVTGEFLHYRGTNERIQEAFRNQGAATDNISGNWINLGYDENPGSTGGYFGIGRINTIAFHPTDPDRFWVGTPRGGIWATQDGGLTWTPMSDFIGHIGVSTIAIPPDFDVSNTIYIGTGDRGHWSDGGIGILKSTDGGATWQETCRTFDFGEHYIGRILIDPDDPQKQYACSSYGVYRTANGWQTDAFVPDIWAIDMEMHPTDHDTIYASTRQMWGNSRVVRSINGGVTWDTVLSRPGIRTELAVSPDEPDWIYAIVANDDRGLEGIYRSTNAGNTFTQVWDGAPLGGNLLGYDCYGWDDGGQAGYDLAIAANPLDANDVWIGGINVWRSTNGGYNWSITHHWSVMCNGTATGVHADQHYFAFQNESQVLFICNDGELIRSEYGYFGPGPFIDLSDGLIINQIYKMSNSQLDWDEIIMGLQDNSTVLWTDGDQEHFMSGDGTDVLINPYDDNIQYYCGNGSYPEGTLDHWGASYFQFSVSDESDDWFKCFRCDPSNPNIMYYGLHKLWKSTDFGINFSLLWAPPDTTVIKQMAVAPSDPNTIVFCNKENLYKTTDGGISWYPLTANLPAGVTTDIITEIIIKEDDPNTIWMTVTGWGAIHVLKSSNGGTTWTDISQGLPSAPIADIIQDASFTTYPILYVGGFWGVFVKLGDQPWVPFNNDLPNLTVTDLDIYYAGGKIRAATFGRGFWESDLYSVEAGMPGIWTGLYNTDWHDYRNWQYMGVPDNNSDVVIPSGCVRNPHIYTGNVTCKNLVVEDGTSLNISGYELTVTEDVVIHGTLRMHITNSKLTINGDISWESGSSFVNTGTDPSLNVAGDWTFQPGASVDLTGSETRFFGSVSSNLYLNDADCDFGHLKVDKTAPASVIYSATSSANMGVQNDFLITSTGKFYQQSNKMLTVMGNLDAQGSFFQQDGTYNCINGGTIFMNSVSYFDTLIIDHSSFTNLLSDIEVRGQLYLKSGLLNIFTHELDLLGDLKRLTDGSISMTTGKVVMMGNNEQKIYSDIYLANVEINSNSDTLRIMDGVDVVIDSLDWTNGGFSLNTGSSLTINELADDGIWGGYCVRPEATLNISNPTGSVNLNGNLFIYGGTVNVYGGATGSYWPDAANAELHMTSGTLDFKDVGIFVRYHPTHTFTENITGGVIRTSKDFMGDHTGFNPSGGAIELYGPDNAGLGHGAGSNFYKVIINKSTPSDKVTVFDNLDINYQLAITSGQLDINGKTVDVTFNVAVNGILKMTNASSILNVGTSISWNSGSSANVSEGLITFKNNWFFNNGTNAVMTGNNTVKAIGLSNTYIYHSDADAYMSNFIIEKTTGSVYLDNNSTYPLRLNGNLTVKNGNSLTVTSAGLNVGGTLETEPTSGLTLQSGGTINATNSIIRNTFNMVNNTDLETDDLEVLGAINLTTGGIVTVGNLNLSGTMDIDAGGLLADYAYLSGSLQNDGGAVSVEVLDLLGTLDVNSGTVFVHNDFTEEETGHLIVDGGFFTINAPYSASTVGFAGTTDLNGGFFEISYKSVKFSTGAVVNILSGTFRVGGDFFATQPNAFKPTFGAVEFIGSQGRSIQCSNGNYFQDLIIHKNTGAGPCTLADSLRVKGYLNILSGQLNTSSHRVRIDDDLRIQSQGVLGAESSDIFVGDEWINNHGTDGFLPGTSNVYLVSAQTCTLPSETFFNLELIKTTGFNQFVDMTTGSTLDILNRLTLSDGTLRMMGNCTLSVHGNFLIKYGAGLNANPLVSGTTVNSYGNWTDQNTTASTQVGFFPGFSTVNFKGGEVQELTATGGATFYHFNLQKSGESFRPYNNVTVSADFNQSGGIWLQSATGLTFMFQRDFTIADGTFWQDPVNTVLFTGDSIQHLTNTGTGFLNFGLLEVTKSQNVPLTINSDISLTNWLIINGGAVSMDDYRLISQNGLIISTGGSLDMAGDVYVNIGADGAIHLNGGNFAIQGTENTRASISRTGTGYYEIMVESGGTFLAEYTDFEYLNTRGLRVNTDGSLGGGFPLYDCSFRQCEPGGVLLQILNSQEITLYSVDFPANTWSGANNIKKDNNAGNVTMAGATGGFAGPLYENDPFGRIHWPDVGIWEGDVSTEWHDARNWRYNYEYPNGSSNVIIPAGVPNFPVLWQTEAYITSLKIEGDASLTIQKDSLFVNTWVDNAGEIIQGDDAGTITALFCDSIVWQPGSSANMTDRSSFYISGNMFIKYASALNDIYGRWYFTGDGDSRLICHDTASINNLFDYKNAGYSLMLEGDTLGQLTCSILRIGAGAYLRCPSSQEWVILGYLRNTEGGHIRLQHGTLRLKGNQGSYFRPNVGDYFNNMVVETTSPINLNSTYSDTLRINGFLVINPSTGTSGIQANNFKIIVGSAWVNNASSSAFQAGTSKVIFTGTWWQEVTGTTFFNYVQAENPGDGKVVFYDYNTMTDMVISSTVLVFGELTVTNLTLNNSLSEFVMMNGGNAQVANLAQAGWVISNGGAMTVTDLAQNYITGAYLINDGLVNIGQDALGSFDLNNAEITVNGGELRFTGGNGTSTWPASSSTASITMTGGILDLTSQEVFVQPTGFSEDISAGLVRTMSSFGADPACTTFHPTGGTVELYGIENCSFSMPEPACWFHNLYLSKTDGGGAYPSSNLRVKNEFRLSAGSYTETDGFTITVGP